MEDYEDNVLQRETVSQPSKSGMKTSGWDHPRGDKGRSDLPSNTEGKITYIETTETFDLKLKTSP